MRQQGIQIESLVLYGWPEIIWQKKETNRLPSTDCAYIQWGYWYAIWNLERGKVIRTDGIRLPDGQDMKDIDEAGYTYIGILETDMIKEKETKGKV